MLKKIAAFFNEQIAPPRAPRTAEEDEHRLSVATGALLLEMAQADSDFSELEEKNYKIQNRVLLSRYRGKTKCTTCKGKRLRYEANFIKVGGKTISDLVDLPIVNLIEFFKKFEYLRFDSQKLFCPEHRIKKITDRLQIRIQRSGFF